MRISRKKIDALLIGTAAISCFSCTIASSGSDLAIALFTSALGYLVFLGGSVAFGLSTRLLSIRMFDISNIYERRVHFRPLRHFPSSLSLRAFRPEASPRWLR